MARAVNLHEVRVLLDRGAQLVEVLPREEYEELRLPRALSLPLWVWRSPCRRAVSCWGACAAPASPTLARQASRRCSSRGPRRSDRTLRSKTSPLAWPVARFGR